MSQEIQLVLSHCSHCNTNTTAPSGYKGLVFCCEPCRTAFNEKKTAEYFDTEANTFLAQNEDFYPCLHNQRLLSDLLATWKLVGTAENLESAYLHLLAEKKILGKLTRRDVDALPSPDYDKRLAIDPAMGGVFSADSEATFQKDKFAAPQIITTGGTGGWQKMAQANLQDRQRQADDRAIARRRS